MMLKSTPSKEQLIRVTSSINPINWEKHNLTVVRDGYLENGTRVQVVKEFLENEPLLIDNAYVVSVY